MEPDKIERKVVVNLAGIELSQAATEALTRGLNYSVTPKRIPVVELITSVEAALDRVDEDAAEAIRLEAAYLIKKARPPKENMTYSQRRALMELRKDENIMVVRADKGNATVVLDRKTYEEKMEALLDPETYERGVKDPTRKIENAINKILKADDFDKRLAAEMAPGGSRVPRIDF